MYDVEIVGVVGSGLVSREIQKFSNVPDIPEKERWSHVGVKFKHPLDNISYFIESHIHTDVHITPWDTWLCQNWEAKKIESFRYQLDVIKLISLVGEPYGTRDVWDLFKKANHIKLIPNRDSKGYFCSEVIVKCDNGTITKILEKPSYETTPADLQKFSFIKNLPVTDIKQQFISRYTDS